MKTLKLLIPIFLAGISFAFGQRSFHVAKNGNDRNPGTPERPLLTITAAAEQAHAGDLVIVHAGTYREWVAPKHGGTDSLHRVTYRAAAGEKVRIRGSEVARGWQPLGHGAWKLTLPDTFFGTYNPYTDLLFGDWFFPWNYLRKEIAYVYYGNQSQFRPGIRKQHTGEVYLNGKALIEADSLSQVLQGDAIALPFGLHDAQANTRLSWYTEHRDGQTVIYANFAAADPNRLTAEINVRPACFYPQQTGVNYITVSGFDMGQCATQWSPPTAEQIGCIGTNWSRGWIIENNVVHDSKCAGITLGKDRASGQNPWSADPSKDGSIYYNNMIVKVISAGWNKATIGSHLVRNNEVFACGQAGICGSFGGAFSVIEKNFVHDIYTRRGFYGAEMGGIKLHGAVDAVIRNNQVRNTYIGIWLDWMAQGTLVSGNTVRGNDYVDFFPEVNHGPYTVSGNRFLSAFSLKDWSEGGTYRRNTFGGLLSRAPQGRETPVFESHSTRLVRVVAIKGGDNVFVQNDFLQNGGKPFTKAAQTYLPEDALDSLRSFDLSHYAGAAQPVKQQNNHFRLLLKR